MRCLVLGASGMLGYQIMGQGIRLGYDMVGTVRNMKYADSLNGFNLKSFDVLPFCNFNMLKEINPDLIINCIGVVVSLCDSVPTVLKVNSCFPHELAESFKEFDTKIIHVSSDGVFGPKQGFGGYTERDKPLPDDLYGMSKYLGEVVDNPNFLTIRTSIIGLEKHKLRGKTGLLEWFLSQKPGSTVNGFKRATWGGFTTNAIARILFELGNLMINGKLKGGLMHIAGPMITKYDLLHIFKEVFNRNITILPYDSFECYRHLKADIFNKLAIKIPDYKSMIEEVKEEINRL